MELAVLPMCEACGKDFRPLRRKQRFCSKACRWTWHHRRRARQAEHLSITAAAQELRLSRHTVRRLIERGKLQAVQVPTAGRPRLEVTRGELERYRAGRAVRRRKPKPGEVDAQIRRAVDEMVERVRDVARRNTL